MYVPGDCNILLISACNLCYRKIKVHYFPFSSRLLNSLGRPYRPLSKEEPTLLRGALGKLNWAPGQKNTKIKTVTIDYIISPSSSKV